MSREKEVRAELKALREREKELLAETETLRGKKRFNCVCCTGQHRIMDCVAMQTHWYTEPSGCTEGDYWNEGELMIQCPATGSWNRILWDSKYKVDWSLRRDYAYNAEAQFKRKYKHLFKEVIDDYEKTHKAWTNSYFFDNHRERFDLHVKGLDPAR